MFAGGRRCGRRVGHLVFALTVARVGCHRTGLVFNISAAEWRELGPTSNLASCTSPVAPTKGSAFSSVPSPLSHIPWQCAAPPEARPQGRAPGGFGFGACTSCASTGGGPPSVTGDSIPAVRRVTKEGLGADLPRIRQSAGTASPASECGKKGTHLNAPPIPLGAIARHRHPRGSRA